MAMSIRHNGASTGRHRRTIIERFDVGVDYLQGRRSFRNVPWPTTWKMRYQILFWGVIVIGGLAIAGQYGYHL